MKFKVTVLHNVSPDMFFGYAETTSKLFHAHDLCIEADAWQQAAELVFELANLDVEDLSDRKALLYGDQVREYRKRMNRSLSVSDVLVLRDAKGELVAVAHCAAIGWEPLDFMPDFKAGSNQSPVSESYKAHQEWRQRAS